MGDFTFKGSNKVRSVRYFLLLRQPLATESEINKVLLDPLCSTVKSDKIKTVLNDQCGSIGSYSAFGPTPAASLRSAAGPGDQETTTYAHNQI